MSGVLNLNFIDKKKGRFLTVMPRTRSEYQRFREQLQAGKIVWQKVLTKPHPKGKDFPDVVISGYEEKSSDGFRLLWYHSTLKQKRDRRARHKKVAKALEKLRDLRPRGRGKGFTSEEAARQRAEKVLDQTKTKNLVDVNLEVIELTKKVQTTRGPKGPNTEYREETKRYYRVIPSQNEAAIKEAEKCDGIFPLITNDKELTHESALGKYKYQPFSEKRHHELKSVFGLIPLELEKPERIECLLWLYHVVEQIQALIERTVREQMKEQQVKSLPVYPESRHCMHPTTRVIRDSLGGHARFRMLAGDGTLLQEFHTPVSDAMKCIIDFLGVDPAVYGLAGSHGE